MTLSALFAPFLRSALAGLTGRWIGARGSAVVTIFGLFTRMVFSYLIFFEVLILGSPVIINLSSWFGAHTVQVDWL
jgi:NADH:ubiquinone oxidoreductase subunit 5 (subunit L)/multisubunit Na+/H+ antiporter MnhA subunit